MKKLLAILIVSFLTTYTLGFQPVDINSASEEQIAILPGIGKKLAHAVVKHRLERGPFNDIAGLNNVPGMTAGKIASLTEKVVFVPKARLKKTHQPKHEASIYLPAKPIMDLLHLEKKVLDFHGLNDGLDRSLLSRAQKAALLPKLQAGFNAGHDAKMTDKGRDNFKDLRLTRGGHDLDFSVRVTFDLEKLIFNKDELEVVKLSLKRLEKREAVLDKLHKLYFSYVRLMESLRFPMEATRAEAVSHELKELELRLDSMSSGSFTYHQEQNAKNASLVRS